MPYTVGGIFTDNTLLSSVIHNTLADIVNQIRRQQIQISAVSSLFSDGGLEHSEDHSICTQQGPPDQGRYTRLDGQGQGYYPLHKRQFALQP